MFRGQTAGGETAPGTCVAANTPAVWSGRTSGRNGLVFEGRLCYLIINVVHSPSSLGILWLDSWAFVSKYGKPELLNGTEYTTLERGMSSLMYYKYDVHGLRVHFFVSSFDRKRRVKIARETAVSICEGFHLTFYSHAHM